MRAAGMPPPKTLPGRNAPIKATPKTIWNRVHCTNMSKKKRGAVKAPRWI